MKGADPPSQKDCYDCIINQWDSNAECANNPNINSNKCTSRGGYCFSIFDARGKFARGCVDSTDPFVKTKEDCEKNKGKCMLCSDTSFCNNNKPKEEKCYEASYDSSETITMNDSYLKTCPQKSFEILGCYHSEKDDKIEKGCMSKLDDDTQRKYRNDEDVEICKYDKCNSKIKQLDCIHCTNEKDTNCAEPSESKKAKDCSQTSNTCLTGIDKDGVTHRTCGISEKKAKEKYEKFEICHGNTCNDHVFPKNRLKCVQCQGETDCELKTPESKKKFPAKVCQTYSDKDECYTYYEDGEFFFKSKSIFFQSLIDFFLNLINYSKKVFNIF